MSFTTNINGEVNDYKDEVLKVANYLVNNTSDATELELLRAEFIETKYPIIQNITTDTVDI